MNKWDFKKLTTFKYQTNNYEITEDFSNILVESSTANIVFVKSTDGKCKVDCYEKEKLTHVVEVVDDTLTIKVNDKRKWYDYVGIDFDIEVITVSLPETSYNNLVVNSNTSDVQIPSGFNFNSINVTVSTGDITNKATTVDGIKIKTTTGNICVENSSAKFIDLSVSTGKISIQNVEVLNDVKFNVSTGKSIVKNVTCKSLTSSGSTGDVNLENVIVNEILNVKRSTGDVNLTKVDANEIRIKTSTGDVKGSILTEKVFIVNTDTGKKVVPNTTTGGRCEITTSTGDIVITIG
jgi:hypothetical protein